MNPSNPHSPAPSDTAQELFHTLWTKAVGTEGYIKTEWQKMQRMLSVAQPSALMSEASDEEVVNDLCPLCYNDASTGCICHKPWRSDSEWDADGNEYHVIKDGGGDTIGSAHNKRLAKLIVESVNRSKLPSKAAEPSAPLDMKFNEDWLRKVAKEEEGVIFAIGTESPKSSSPQPTEVAILCHLKRGLILCPHERIAFIGCAECGPSVPCRLSAEINGSSLLPASSPQPTDPCPQCKYHGFYACVTSNKDCFNFVASSPRAGEPQRYSAMSSNEGYVSMHTGEFVLFSDCQAALARAEEAEAMNEAKDKEIEKLRSNHLAPDSH